MKPWLKFWLASTLILFLLALWPFIQLGGSAAAPPDEQQFASDARLVDHFCLSRIPTSGKASVPSEWEKALNVEIKIRENAGEATGDIGFPRERASELTSLKPGEGLVHSDPKGHHYVLKSDQGRGWFVVLSKEPRSGGINARTGGGISASPVAWAVAFAVVAGALLTLLASIAFRSKQS